MTKPRNKPQQFEIVTEDNMDIKPAGVYRKNIKWIVGYMADKAVELGTCVTLINSNTRNAWTVNPEGRWS